MSEQSGGVFSQIGAGIAKLQSDIADITERLSFMPRHGWATVTQVDPLRIRWDGEANPVEGTPSAIASGFMVGDRVWVTRQFRRDLVHGVAGAGQFRVFALKSHLDAWAAPDGTVAYVTSENRHYVRTGGAWDDPGTRIPNRVLWAGTQWMIADQTATLSELVSVQRSGIMLVWSEWNDGPANSNWRYTFVPKQHVVYAPGGSLSIPFLDAQGSYRKYVYVHNDRVTGHSLNGNAPSNKSALRYVLGV